MKTVFNTKHGLLDFFIVSFDLYSSRNNSNSCEYPFMEISLCFRTAWWFKFKQRTAASEDVSLLEIVVVTRDSSLSDFAVSVEFLLS